MKNTGLIAAALAGLIAGTSAIAGPVADYETAFRATYGAYRAALFGTNAGKADEAQAAIAKLQAGFSGLMATYGDAPPPQYADDPTWGATMAKVGGLVATAKAEAGDGKLAEAHETLEGVRDLIGDLHARNGVETFSDRMNAYHAEMEHVLGMDLTVMDAASIGALRERAAVLEYLAKDVLAAPPPEGVEDPAYEALSQVFGKSVSALLDAARAGEAGAIKAAVGQLKPAYSKFFLKFG